MAPVFSIYPEDRGDDSGRPVPECRPFSIVEAIESAKSAYFFLER
jgi:hypothetical protein